MKKKFDIQSSYNIFQVNIRDIISRQNDELKTVKEKHVEQGTSRSGLLQKELLDKYAEFFKETMKCKIDSYLELFDAKTLIDVVAQDDILKDLQLFFKTEKERRERSIRAALISFGLNNSSFIKNAYQTIEEDFSLIYDTYSKKMKNDIAKNNLLAKEYKSVPSWMKRNYQIFIIVLTLIGVLISLRSCLNKETSESNKSFEDARQKFAINELFLLGETKKDSTCKVVWNVTEIDSIRIGPLLSTRKIDTVNIPPRELKNMTICFYTNNNRIKVPLYLIEAQ